jgi:hypothetical protein
MEPPHADFEAPDSPEYATVDVQVDKGARPSGALLLSEREWSETPQVEGRAIRETLYYNMVMAEKNSNDPDERYKEPGWRGLTLNRDASVALKIGGDRSKHEFLRPKQMIDGELQYVNWFDKTRQHRMFEHGELVLYVSDSRLFIFCQSRYLLQLCSF